MKDDGGLRDQHWTAPSHPGQGEMVQPSGVEESSVLYALHELQPLHRCGDKAPFEFPHGGSNLIPSL